MAVTVTIRTVVADALEPQGPAARSIADLWWVLLALGVLVYTIVVVLLLVGLFRRRPDGAVDHEQPRRDPVRWWIVGGGVVLPAVVLTAVLALTVESMLDAEDESADALVVEVVGHQWWWEIRYPGNGVTTANELHLPVGRPVRLELTSADVIHSFWVPALAGKLDLLPDGTNTLVIRADEPGELRGECAEFCGLQHTNMQLDVVAEPAEAFERWLAEASRPAAAPAGTAASRGREVFLERGCASCHTVRGTAAAGDEGPDLTHLASRPTLGAGAAENTPAALEEWVTDPHTRKEGVRMPAPDLAAEERADLLAYLEGLG